MTRRHGHESKTLLETMQGRLNQLNGYENAFRGTTAQEFILENLTELDQLPDAAPLALQNPDGSWIDYIPGLDGPINP